MVTYRWVINFYTMLISNLTVKELGGHLIKWWSKGILNEWCFCGICLHSHLHVRCVGTELRIKRTCVMWRSARYFHMSNTMTQAHCPLENLQHEVSKIICACSCNYVVLSVSCCKIEGIVGILFER